MKALSGMLSNPDGNMSQLLVNMGRDGAHLGENSSWQWTFWSGTDGVGTAMALIRCLAVILRTLFPTGPGDVWVPGGSQSCLPAEMMNWISLFEKNLERENIVNQNLNWKRTNTLSLNSIQMWL